eukprot:CAMPEP_0115871160 /NCGR_PEP_ID=MMETSP0287-20121206/22716_1 /TAXON_ID=412157 /ORGANISM="Chrysochromulina rotalis, Strain UIO044" /LENGTH=48 /DNA_ID= /DNA_START= /DNA_END= /DNA_ORIENTATION=
MIRERHESLLQGKDGMAKITAEMRDEHDPVINTARATQTAHQMAKDVH